MSHANNTGFTPESLRLLGAALALQQTTSTAADLIPIPNTGRFIAIGTPAEVARLLEIAPATQTERALWVGIIAKVRADLAAADQREAAKTFLLQVLDSIDVYVRESGLLDVAGTRTAASSAAPPDPEHDHSEGGHHD